MASLFLLTAGFLAVVLAALRWYRARAHLTPGTRYLCAAVAFVGLSAALASPAALAVTIRVEPFPGAARLLANGLAMASAWCVHGLLVNLVAEPAAARRAVRRQLLLLVAWLLAMTALLASAPIESGPDFVAEFAGEPQVVGYVLLFSGYIAWSLGNFLRLIQHYRRFSDRPRLRWGLVIAQVGTGVGVAWAVWKSSAAVVVFATGTRLVLEGPVSAALSAGCVALIAVGVTLPTWLPPLTAPLRWAGRYRAHRDLAPLWSALRAAMPQLGGGDEGGPLEWRLTRRLVEVRDGLLLLAPYRADLDAELRDCPDPAVREAARIAAALAALTGGADPRPDPPLPPTGQDGGAAAEMAWLRRVSRAYRTSPVVRPYRPVEESR
ncbi:MAB_1171c family putative transporter [Saccharopolyspora cebuensis]|uniref:MAB_1171c family putative transporter n=1 Tax=Saccharopolyspora cebuensis TaxID=418759 RepID=A0ABV4CF93_9PSEU